MTNSKRPDEYVTARYLANQLSDADRESFEAYFLEQPDVVTELELDAKLKAGLMGLQERGDLATMAGARRRIWPSRPLALAASILLAAFGIAIWITMTAPSRSVLASSAAEFRRAGQPAPTVTYEVIRTRTNSYDAVIPLPANAQAVGLQLNPGVVSRSSTYDISLRSVGADESKTEVGSISRLSTDDDGLLNFYLNSEAVEPGVYELQISAARGAAASENNTFVLQLLPASTSSTNREQR